MEKEILSKILEQLEQAGNDQLLILIGMFGGMLLINLLQAVYTSRIVEQYKNELKKREVKFSVFNQIQIEKLSELFELAHEFKSSTASFVVISEENRLNEITGFNGLDSSYDAISDCYSRNRYIFPQNIKSHFKNHEKDLMDFKFNIEFLIQKNEITNSVEENQITNLELIDKEIGAYNYEKGSLEVMLFCEKLKVLIEEHFEEWD